MIRNNRCTFIFLLYTTIYRTTANIYVYIYVLNSINCSELQLSELTEAPTMLL